MTDNAKVVAFFNNKGGVLKTTSTVNVAGVLNNKGKKVLIIDTDPQGHVAFNFGIDANELEATLGILLYNNIFGLEARDYFLHVADNIDIVPSNQQLVDFMSEKSGEPDSDQYLKKFIQDLLPLYDYILIDMAPAADMFLRNVVEVVDDLLVLTKLETLGANSTIHTLNITDQYNVEIRRIIPTITKLNTKIQQHELEELKDVAKEHNIKVTNTTIADTVKFAESLSIYQMPLTLVDNNNYKKQRENYEALVAELGY